MPKKLTIADIRRIPDLAKIPDLVDYFKSKLHVDLSYSAIYDEPAAVYNGYLSDPDENKEDATAKRERLLKRAHELNKALPSNASEYWIVKGDQLEKVSRKEMIEIANIGRNLSSFGV